MKVLRLAMVSAAISAFAIGMSLAQAPQGGPGGGGRGPGAGGPGGGGGRGPGGGVGAPGGPGGAGAGGGARQGGAPGGPGGPGGGARQGGGGGGRGGGPAFNVTSPSFPDGGEIPLKFSFYGDNVSPQFDFRWFNGTAATEQPATVQSFAIIFRDMENATARGPADTLHWSLFNIPGTAKGIAEGKYAAGGPADGPTSGPGIGNRGGTGGSYFGPGAGAGPYHHYMFEFFALDTKLTLAATATREQLLAAMENHVVGKAVYGGRFAQTPAK